jgi:hypothetical protein
MRWETVLFYVTIVLLYIMTVLFYATIVRTRANLGASQSHTHINTGKVQHSGSAAVDIIKLL